MDFGHTPPSCEFICRACDRSLTIAVLLQQAEQAQKWEPIETAPKDGTPILLHRNGHGVDVGYWRPTDDSLRKKPVPCWRYRRSHSISYDRAHQPTHWQPLPPPPTQAQGASPTKT